MATRKPESIGIQANRRLVTETWEYVMAGTGSMQYDLLPVIAADLKKDNAVMLHMSDTDGVLLVTVERD